jgi:hypothetical protein
MFGLNKKKKKKDLKIGKKSLLGTMKSQTGYKNYVINGGEKSFEQWKKGER